MARLDKLIYRLELALCFFFCVVMILIVSAEVISRYCFGSTLMVGVQELAMWAFIWMVTMACAALAHEKKHIAVEYFMDKFCPARLQGVIYLLTEAFLMFFFIAIIWTGYPFAFDQWSMRTTSANIPKTIPFLAVPVSITFMLVHSLVQFGDAIKDLTAKSGVKES